MNANLPSYIKTLFCETCTTDGCNGEAMNPVVSAQISENVTSIEGRIDTIDGPKNVDQKNTTCNQIPGQKDSAGCNHAAIDQISDFPVVENGNSTD